MAIKAILCPVDFSDAARHAARYATTLARIAHATVIGLHVHQPALATISAAIGRDDPVAEPLLPGSPEVQGRISAQFADEEFKGDEEFDRSVLAELAVGAPAEAIAERALTDSADLVVIGTRGAGGLQHLLLGSVTEDVIRRSSVPVLAIPPGAPARPRLPFTRVLCATDFSASSLVAIEVSLRLPLGPEPQVTMLHVIDDPDENDLFVARPYDVHRHADALEARVRDSVEQVAGPLFERHRPPAVCVAHGSAAAQILAAAREIDADLIVMGVHGRNALGIAIFGSTTNDVVRRADCPVLTARR